jgi:hypothetical protein
MTSRYTVGRGGKASLLGRSLSPKPVAYVAILLPNPLKTNIVGPHGEEARAVGDAPAVAQPECSALPVSLSSLPLPFRTASTF